MSKNGTHHCEISLIICTRNRASSLRGCLDALAALQFDPQRCELIFVNDASTDSTDETLRAFAEQVPFRTVVVRNERPGLSRARNTGVKASQADLIAFTDDDCYVAPDFLTRVVDAFREPSYGFIGGRVLLHDPSDAPETIKEDDQPEEVDPFTIV